MDKSKLNIKERANQYKNLIGAISVISISAILLFSVLDSTDEPKTNASKKTKFDALVDDSFSKDSQESVLTSAQMEIEGLKSQVKELVDVAKQQKQELSNNAVQMASLEQQIKDASQTPKALPEKLVQLAKNDRAGQNNQVISDAYPVYKEEPVNHSLHKSGGIHTVSSHYSLGKASPVYKRNINNYVPAGSFAKAVVLGGVDADASVEGALKNNGAILFKIISNGILPNGKSSHLKGCFVTASATGDVSSERAYITLDRLSCAQKNEPIIDKKVHGWVFFAGKAGIKGQVEMRDDKVAKWAFLGKGIESAGKIVGTMQNITTASNFGVTSFLPSDKVLAAGGASAVSGVGEELSRYYIRRAEQYHPTINIGAGNLTNIVFREGFSLSADDSDIVKPRDEYAKAPRHQITNQAELPKLVQENIPDEVLKSAGVGNAYAFDNTPPKG